jgi:hypothetical protein
MMMLDGIHRLNNDPDFRRICAYLEENKHNIAHQAVYSQGPVSDEYSGAYKLMEEILRIISLEEYKDRPEALPRWKE